MNQFTYLNPAQEHARSYYAATANGLHAATYASRSGSRLVIIFGDHPVSNGAVNSLGPDYKGFNATGVLAAAGIRTFVATSPDTARGALATEARAKWEMPTLVTPGRSLTARNSPTTFSSSTAIDLAP